MKITIPNAQIIEATDDHQPLDEYSDLFNIKEKKAYSVNARRSGGQSESLDLEVNEIVEVILNDGSRWFLGNEEFEEMAAQNPQAVRGQKRDEFILEPGLFSATHTRGIAEGAINKIRTFILESLPDLKQKGKDLAGEVVTEQLQGMANGLIIDPVAFYIARRFEKNLATNGVSKVCKLEFNSNSKVTLTPVDEITTKGRGKSAASSILLLLHGTLSSTEGSFSGLWLNHSAKFIELMNRYDGNVYSLEHCTLTESPIQNALLVANALPEQCDLHLLSHSRGGIVGELLCRGSRKEQTAFAEEELNLLKNLQTDGNKSKFDLSAEAFNAIRKHRKNESIRLEALNKALSAKELTISRFVRVACPARGTTLASGKLNRWANRSLNAIGLLTGAKANPLYRIFEAFALGVLNSKSKPEVLPGLQAQMPDSALIHVLNNPDSSVPADLCVVAGDVELESGINWKKVPLWLTDQFFGGKHDLVVNTASMDGGSDRENGIRRLFIAEEHTNHFSYFSDPDSGNQILESLIRGPTERFRLVEQTQDIDIPRSAEVVHAGNKPVLVLIPGILGTQLSHNNNRIWINVLRLAMGGISDLAYGQTDVKAEDLVSLPYSEFIRHFSSSHDIHVCPYDWRLSLRESAKVLEILLKEILEKQRQDIEPQPIRIVAHSMGGLVMRVLIAQNSELWEQIRARSGSRFIMAGTPTNGSYAINRILAGELKLIKLLALADIKNSKKQITDIAAKLPAVAAMLPGFGEHEWLLPSTWRKLDEIPDADCWSVVSPELLAQARLERKLILDSPIHEDSVAYVAGKSDWTPSDIVLKDKEFCFIDTEAGDGQVTWDDGIPKNLSNVWYQPSVHGSMLADKEYFSAWRDLLERGNTSRLSRTPPVSRTAGGFETRRVRDDEPVDYLPDERSLIQIALAMEPPSLYRKSDQSGHLKITIAHGDLGFASYPVAVGHYDGDSILAAEKALDHVLDHRLSERYSVGQYPGRINTSEVIFTQLDSTTPEGALIIGLGRFGELTLPRLERTLVSAMTKYILELNELKPVSQKAGQKSITGLSVLLIGSSIGSLSLRDSAGALIKAAIAANEAIKSLHRRDYRLLEAIEIIELWEDLALEAAHAASAVASQLTNTHQTVIVEPEVDTKDGGRSRSGFRQESDWWHTIMVKKDPTADAFQYYNYTRHARTELTDEPVDMHFVDQFLESIVHTSRRVTAVSSSPQKALFELLLPLTLKEASPDSDKLRMLLDEHSARIPWEMLIDGWSEDQKPLAASKRMIRQLSIDVSQTVREPARGIEAIVVGDPPSSNYPPLHGARAEAHRVTALLEEIRRYKVDAFINDDSTAGNTHAMATQIVESLLSNEYVIMHFAAHGSFTRSTASQAQYSDMQEGMVIGNGLTLTPRLVNKIRKAPTLVFLNCCHLGFIENRGTEQRVRYHQIAANLATQFIKIGTKVVIAAGWEVEDLPAKRFAEVFYTSILSNVRLGEAITRARKTVFEEHNSSNTFGAYQCWGDPEFRLDPRQTSRRKGGRGKQFRSARECLIEAENIRNQALTATDEANERLTDRAKHLKAHLLERYGDPWASSPAELINWKVARVKALCAMGLAFGELGIFDQSILIIRKAWSLNPSAVSFRDLEQLANFECRLAHEMKSAKDRDQPLAVAAELGTIIDLLSTGQRRLKVLLDQYIADEQLSSLREILCLIASAERRRILIVRSSEKQTEKSLRTMAHYYGLGWIGRHGDVTEKQALADYVTVAENNHCKPDSYAFLNFAVSWIIYNWFQNQPLDESLIENARHYTEASMQPPERPKFWQAMQKTEAILLQYLDNKLREKLDIFTETEDLLSLIKTEHRKLGQRFGSKRQWASSLDFYKFISVMLDKAQEKRNSQRKNVLKEKRKGINEIIENIESILNS